MNSLQLINRQTPMATIDWPYIIQCLKDGHQLERAHVQDSIIERNGSTLLSRSASIKGLGFGVKSVTITDHKTNISLPSVQGAMLLFDEHSGQAKALIDAELVTYWKTAADSVLGAQLLAKPASRTLMILGAGIVAESLVRAYCACFKTIDKVLIQNRTPSRAATLASKLRSEGYPCEAIESSTRKALAKQATSADIISTATTSEQPILFGNMIAPGTHIDLVGAYTPKMREADDALIQKSSVFVDCRDTTVDHIGEISIPISTGIISHQDICGDLYDLVNGHIHARSSSEEITVYKNGGGAHLDLMTAHALLNRTS